MHLRENHREGRFELPLEDGSVAFVSYTIDRGVDGDRLFLTHAEVPGHLEGQGVGSHLAGAVFEEIRSTGRRAVPICPFLILYAKRHPEIAAAISG